MRLITLVLCLLFLMTEGRAETTVLSVTPGSAAAEADVRVDDRLLEWQAGAQSGIVRNAFDLHLLEAEQGHLGRVSIRGKRGDADTAWTLNEAPWG